MIKSQFICLEVIILDEEVIIGEIFELVVELHLGSHLPHALWVDVDAVFEAGQSDDLHFMLPPDPFAG
jgi:hypothetical protein